MATADPVKVMAARDAARDARTWAKTRSSVERVGVGFRYRDGKVTDEVCVVVGVREKGGPDAEREMVPSAFAGEMDVEFSTPTDVQQAPKYVIQQELEATPQSLTSRERPCPPGYSTGHPAITAGTLGFWYLDEDGFWYFVSNNHVVAASNDASINDWIWQPGRADQGGSLDRIGQLTAYVEINFASGNGGKKSPKRLFWRTARAVPNGLASLVRCEYRLGAPRISGVITQPNPNKVDAAKVRAISPEVVKLDIPNIGPIVGMRDAQLGDEVRKTGRTTETTYGRVEVIDSSV
ncbi:MAG: hypothetical protein V3U85_10280, partial [Hyphomicrobium sp.]